MIRSFFLLPFIMVVSMGVYPAKAANEGGHDISCGDHRYFIETSWFGADVRIININDNAATDHPYCQSNAADQMVAKLSVNGDCLLYTSPSPRDLSTSRMPSSA